MTTTNDTNPHPVPIAGMSEGDDNHGDPLAELLAITRRCPWCSRYLCAVCFEPIPKRAKARWTVDTHRIACLRCCDRRGRQAHAVLFPDCPERWHDVEDHSGILCTTGGLRRVIAEQCAS